MLPGKYGCNGVFVFCFANLKDKPFDKRSFFIKIIVYFVLKALIHRGLHGHINLDVTNF